MLVFLWEALSARVATGEEAAESLRREGEAMLWALIADVLRIEDCRAATILAAPGAQRRLPADRRLTVNFCGSAAEERRTFARLAFEADRTWIIAPETGGLLAERTAMVLESGGCPVGADLAAIQLCADKLRLANVLADRGIPTLPSWPFPGDHWPSDLSFPCVVKPRFGAGSLHCRLIRTPDEWPSRSCGDSSLAAAGELIVQPYRPGASVSVSAVIPEEGGDPELFPVGRQRLSDDGRFVYLGGRISTRCFEYAGVHELVRRVCSGLSGLRGYVGFDAIVSEENAQDVWLVEINPRLTTSYVGYRELTAVNLAERVLFPVRNAAPIAWRADTVTFFPEGRVLHESWRP